MHTAEEKPGLDRKVRFEILNAHVLKYCWKLCHERERIL